MLKWGKTRTLFMIHLYCPFLPVYPVTMFAVNLLSPFGDGSWRIIVVGSAGLVGKSFSFLVCNYKKRKILIHLENKSCGHVYIYIYYTS